MPKKITHILILLSVLLSACNVLQEENPLPTEANLEDVATAAYLTQVAPPEGFSTVSFPQIDQQLDQLSTSRFTINVTFDGVYTDTNERTTGAMRLEVVANELTVARDVKIEFDGDVFSGEASNLNAVRLSNSYYMINPNGVCITDAGQITQIANIQAGQLIGGFETAGPTGQNAMVNNVQAWQYGFAPEDVVKPQVQTDAELDLLTGEAWVAPEYQVVVRYIVELNVQNAKLLFGERTVTGRVRYEYNVHDINGDQNISIPNGC